MENCLVSIIIPTKNRASLLKYAVDSCINQTYKNLQIIVHDNNSSDNTQKIVQSLSKDKRIKYYNTKHDLTMKDNWNKAVNYIKGKYFLRLDDDNVLSPTIIEEAVKNIHKNNLHCLAYSPLIVHPGKKQTIFFKESEKIHLLNEAQIICFNYHCIIDSNYVIYKTKTVRKLLGKRFYVTTLPDRYLDYIIACNMKKEKIRYGLSTKIKGITRHDYKYSEKKAEMNALNLVKIKKAYSKARFDNINNIDCHNNFMLHRYVTAMTALTNQGNESICQYFNKKIATFNIYEIIFLIGVLYECNRYYSIPHFIAYANIFLYTASKLLAKPRLIIEGRRSYTQIFFLLALMTFRIQKSLFKKASQKIKTEFGDELCRKMLLNKEIDIKKAKVEFKDTQSVMKKLI